VDNRGSNSTGCFRIKVRTDTAELTNMRIAGLRKWWVLIRESQIFIKDKTKVACRMSGIEWRVVYFRKLLFKTTDEKFSVERVKSKKICRHPGGDVFQSNLEVGDTWVKVARMKREKSWVSSHITPILRFLHWLKINKRIEYKLLSLTYKVLTTSQPDYLHYLHNWCFTLSLQLCLRSAKHTTKLTLLSHVGGLYTSSYHTAPSSPRRIPPPAIFDNSYPALTWLDSIIQYSAYRCTYVIDLHL